MVEEPAPVIDAGLKVIVTPEGCPDAERVMVPSKPPVTVLVMVTLPVPPSAIEIEEGELDGIETVDQAFKLVTSKL